MKYEPLASILPPQDGVSNPSVPQSKSNKPYFCKEGGEAFAGNHSLYDRASGPCGLRIRMYQRGYQGDGGGADFRSRRIRNLPALHPTLFAWLTSC